MKEAVVTSYGLKLDDGPSRNNTGAKKTLLMISNFLYATHGVRGVCEEMASRFVQAGWPVIATSSKPKKINRLIDMLCTIWRRRDEYALAHVDVFSGAAFFWAEAACWTLRRAGKSYILTLHGGNLPSFAGRWPRRVRNLLSSAAVVTTPSRYLLEQMQSYRANLILQPNPLDIERYEFRLRKRAQPRLVWLRAFHEIYNPALAIKVVWHLAQFISDVQLMMIGPDKDDGSLGRVRQVAEKLGVANRIKFIGAVPKSEVSHWLQHGDIFLNTANIDNAPVSVLEAMACGLCIVSTDVGGMTYLLDDGHDSLLVPPDEPAAMADAVRRMMVESGLAPTLSRNARAKAEQYDWSIVLPRWEDLIISVGAKEF